MSDQRAGDGEVAEAAMTAGDVPHNSPKWRVWTYGTGQWAHRGLAFGGDWKGVEHLAELLSGEDEGRVSVADVERLLDIIEKGLADD